MNEQTEAPRARARSGHWADHWAESGAVWLTGRPDGPALLPPGDAASRVAAELDDLAQNLQRLTGHSPSLPGVGVLGERAGFTGATRQGPFAPGGRTRALRTRDGWVALTLARPEDVDLVPALCEGAVPTDSQAADPAADLTPDLTCVWAALEVWAGGVTTAEADARIRLLSLPGRGVDSPAAARPAPRPGVRVTPGGPRPRTPGEAPLVVDFSSLWAGPLCAHLLGLGGARVVKVESTHRPDGAREGNPDFYDLLHAGHDAVAVDFSSTAELARLRALVARADVVIEASRPRALARLGLDADALVAGGAVWLSITAEGRDVDAIGFGDDIALGAGLAVRDGEDLLPVGDALADPLSGVVGAASVARALLEPHGALLDLSMLDVCRETLAGPAPSPDPNPDPRPAPHPGPDATGPRFHAPLPRTPAGPATGAGTGHAAPLGAHTDVWLR